MNVNNFSIAIEIASNIIQSIAIIIGGIWAYVLFIRNRQNHPKVSVSHHVEQRCLPNGKIYLHVSILIENKGTVLMRLSSCEVRIRRVLPFTDEIAKSVYFGKDPVKKKETEISWYLISKRKTKRETKTVDCLAIEPSETGIYNFDFIIDREEKTIQILSFTERETRNNKLPFQKARPPIGYLCTSLHDVVH